MADTDDDEQSDDVQVVLDLSGDDVVDAGVTSGSDSSGWDPNNVDPK